MTGAATDVILARAARREHLTIMVWWSAAAHVALGGLVAVMPAERLQATPRMVMTISLGGAGALTGGMTPMGGPAAASPEVVPSPATPPLRVTETTRPARSRPPARRQPEAVSQPAPGPEGPTRTDTRVRGQGFGLSGGGGASGGAVQLDVADFCCQEYLDLMVTLIHRNWDSKQGVVGTTGMKFTITRDGSIQAIQLERGSGFFALDSAASRALGLTRLPALPAAFPNPMLTVHMRFEYQL